jgi:uracil phosphoribosyltransferase (EC 2.4.2.9)
MHDWEFDIDISYVKIPGVNEDNIVILSDVMVATGSTLVKVLRELVKYSKAKKILHCISYNNAFSHRETKENLRGARNRSQDVRCFHRPRDQRERLHSTRARRCWR